VPRELVRKFEQMFVVSGTIHGVPGTAPTDMEKVNWLYSVLTILDGKAGALLAFDGLMLAAEALMYDKMSEKIDWLHPYSLLLVLVTLVAALLCLFVAQVSYAFLGNIVLGTPDNTAEITELERVAEIRTGRLGMAWGIFCICSHLLYCLGSLCTFERVTHEEVDPRRN
jgi:hypothetical protein